MKVCIIISTLLVAASADTCYKMSEATGGSSPIIKQSVLSMPNCNATYGGIIALQPDLQEYVNHHIEVSFEFLLMSSYFGNYKMNREGFKSLYRKLSDQAWEDSIDLIKFIAERGGSMDFEQKPKHKRNPGYKRIDLEQAELNSLALALDTEKRLATEALRIHAETMHHDKKDGSVAHYLEEKFMEPQAECVRNLAGHVTDLKQLQLCDADASVALFLFDEYLQKIV